MVFYFCSALSLYIYVVWSLFCVFCPLCRWLKQRMPSGKWEERYIIVKGAHILWNDTKIEIDDDRDRNQRRKFRNEYNLLSVEKIESIDSRSQQKFKFQIGTNVRSKKTLVFIWKSDNKKSRDKWVESLQQKKELLTAFHDYLVEWSDWTWKVGMECWMYMLRVVIMLVNEW